jgi:iron complex outermembrane recepter protein
VILGTPQFLIDGLGVLVQHQPTSDKSTRQDYASNTGWTAASPTSITPIRRPSPIRSIPTSTPMRAAQALACQNASNADGPARWHAKTQFFDWAPNGPRYRNLVRRDKRLSADLTVTI